MLFAVTWVNRGGATEERDKRALKLFTNWKPPAGFDFKGFYDYVDGNGGVAIVEATSAEAMFEVFAPVGDVLSSSLSGRSYPQRRQHRSSKRHSLGAILYSESLLVDRVEVGSVAQ